MVTSPNDDRAYNLITLGNGIEVILVSDPAAEKSAAALSVGLGASSDPEDYPGMAHYLEHMMFRGTERHPQADYEAAIQGFGADNNAYTTHLKCATVTAV